MMPNITRGQRLSGLMYYLVGPGKHNEHSNPRVVAASCPVGLAIGGDGREMDARMAHDLADHLDIARVVHGVAVPQVNGAQRNALMKQGADRRTAVLEATSEANVWHCSLSLRAEEGALTDELWGTIAHDFMKRMGFDDELKSPARWAAVNHGVSQNGNHHIHIAASMVRDDGSLVDLFVPDPKTKKMVGDFRRAQQACAALETTYGLEVTEGRAAGIAERGQSRAQKEIAAREGSVLTKKQELTRRVRACSTAARSEAEFVRLVRGQGVLIRPFYAKGGTAEVAGYSVALKPDTTSKAVASDKPPTPIWHGGGKLGSDLTLTRLRQQWPQTQAHREQALQVWRSSSSRITADRSRRPGRFEGQGPELAEMTNILNRWEKWVDTLEPGDVHGWAQAARTTAGLVSAWSLRHPDAASGYTYLAQQLERAAGIATSPPPPMPRRKPPPPTHRVALLMVTAISTGNETMMMMLMLKAIADATHAIANAQHAAGMHRRSADLAAAAHHALAAHRTAVDTHGRDNFDRDQALIQTSIGLASGPVKRRPAPGSAATQKRPGGSRDYQLPTGLPNRYRDTNPPQLER